MKTKGWKVFTLVSGERGGRNCESVLELARNWAFIGRFCASCGTSCRRWIESMEPGLTPSTEPWFAFYEDKLFQLMDGEDIGHLPIPCL